jgi:hippurate hydrolase
MPSPQELLSEAQKFSSTLSTIRRELHAMPEFGLELPNTQQRILASIEGLGEITLGKSLNSIALLIRGGKPGPTVLLRADMDALAVVEESGEEFSSRNGFMHACGHDLHMAGAIGAAHLLHTHREELSGNVLIWWQPGEEGHHGADVMIEEGMLEVSGSLPIAAYGIHVFTKMPLGAVASKPGPLMASAGDLLIELTGSGGHGSMPWLSRDPIAPLMEIATTLPQLIAKRFDAFDPVIVNIGWLRAGDTATTNVIPDSAALGATVRTFSHRNSELLRQLVPDLVSSIASAYGVSARVEFGRATKVVLNSPDAVEIARKVTESMLGAGSYQALEHPIPGGEDFASILEVVGGAFVFVGACPPDLNWQEVPSNHSARAKFDDSVLPQVASLLAGFAFEQLNSSR